MKRIDPLSDEPYSWRESRGKIRIYWRDVLASTLRGNEADRFLARILEADAKESQLIMVKKTGNFKRGNEQNISRKGRLER